MSLDKECMWRFPARKGSSLLIAFPEGERMALPRLTARRHCPAFNEQRTLIKLTMSNCDGTFLTSGVPLFMSDEGNRDTFKRVH
ncbi:hypothetical protein EMWEY_00047300 [Eimeria maxima]|uniref:Uncharacterized protein n=1 Tax=Eimeria maxima TaxID=5804 RepID=U6M4T7_EIMMA|nr:hypothetical protein EMWEY_00047300 [Eimeria maxima]CDJ58068.1 hypothetical protein EMWEY_00047300 [Eimeria maxima]